MNDLYKTDIYPVDVVREFEYGGFELFIHKMVVAGTGINLDKTWWSVSEKTTGRGICSGNTIKKVTQRAKQIIDEQIKSGRKPEKVLLGLDIINPC